MEGTIALLGVIAYIAFRNWLKHQRRILIHRERVAALERGVELPPLETDSVSRFQLNRLLLLLGLSWIAIGVCAYVVLSAMLSTQVTKEIPEGMQYVSIAPTGIGIAHLITYFVMGNRT